MSVMISVLISFIRMSRDNEITALKAGGIIVYRLLTPVLFFCTLATLLTLWINLYAQPWGNRTVEGQGIKIAQSSLNIALKERRFNNIFNGVMIYVNSKDIQTQQLKNVYIEDSRINGKISISIAPAGILFSDAKKMLYTLRLYNGMVNQVDIETKSVNTVHFTTYDINLDFHPSKLRSRRKSKDIDEMSLRELLKFKGKISTNKELLNSVSMEINERLSIPFACISFGILSFALGLHAGSLRRSSSLNLGFGIFFFLLYYLLLVVGWSLGNYRFYPPVVGMWLPDFVIAFAGIYLLRRMVNERPFHLPGFMYRYIAIYKRKLKIKKHF